jgi:hypothetical protein
MSEGTLNNWVRMTLLLGALAAGTVATQFVPKYQDASRTVTYPSRAASMNRASAPTNHGASDVDVDARHLTLVRSSS